MKIQLSLLLIVVGTACNTASEKQKPEIAQSEFNEQVELAAIMKVIQSETDCFYNSDYKCWAAQWSHEPYVVQAWNNDDGSANAAVGWQSIDTQVKGWIEKYYKNGEVVIHPAVKRDKPLVKFFSNTAAYLTWKQYNADKAKAFWISSQEIRIMEKTDSAWKIVAVSGFWGTQKKVPFDSLQTN